MLMPWDAGIEYEQAKRTLKQLIKNEMLSIEVKKQAPKKTFVYLTILSIQLRNGLRVTEAIQAFHAFMKNDADKVEYRVLKKRSQEVIGVAYFPEFLPRQKVLRYCKVVLDKGMKPTRQATNRVARRYLSCNTHSLRYARISFLLEKGIHASIVAKTTHHSSLNFVLKYTQEKIAERVHKEFY